MSVSLSKSEVGDDMNEEIDGEESVDEEFP